MTTLVFIVVKTKTVFASFGAIDNIKQKLKKSKNLNQDDPYNTRGRDG